MKQQKITAAQARAMFAKKAKAAKPQPAKVEIPSSKDGLEKMVVITIEDVTHIIPEGNTEIIEFYQNQLS